MSQKPADLDIAAILEALRAEVRAARASVGEEHAGVSGTERELRRAVEEIEIARVVSAHWPLDGKNLYERAWVMVHRVVRRALQWYIPPIVLQQNAFNDAAARSIRLLIDANAELRDQLADLRRQLDQPPPAGSAPRDSAPIDDPQQLVERNGRAEPPAPLPDLGLRPLPAQAAELAAVSAHWDLGGDTPLTRARALAQKGIRQYLRWMINPIVEQQNAANAAISGALPHLVAADAELRASVAALRAQR